MSPRLLWMALFLMGRFEQSQSGTQWNISHLGPALLMIILGLRSWGRTTFAPLHLRSMCYQGNINTDVGLEQLAEAVFFSFLYCEPPSDPPPTPVSLEGCCTYSHMGFRRPPWGVDHIFIPENVPLQRTVLFSIFMCVNGVHVCRHMYSVHTGGCRSM